MAEWTQFKGSEYEKEEEFLFKMERIYRKKEENKIEDKEWFTTWMLMEARKRKGIQGYETQELRNIVKAGGEQVMTEFMKKYKELRVENNRDKVAETYYMGHESLSRQRYREQRGRRESQGRETMEKRRLKRKRLQR